jgi:hypothetical protein
MSNHKESSNKERIKDLELRINYLEQLLTKNNIPFDEIHKTEVKTTFSNQEKLRIYKDYFKGRQDCYAMRWEKEGKSGYSPVYLDQV